MTSKSTTIRITVILSSADAAAQVTQMTQMIWIVILAKSLNSLSIEHTEFLTKSNINVVLVYLFFEMLKQMYDPHLL